MHRTALALLTVAALTGCSGGPSDKQQATKAAVAYQKASLLDDYEAEWNLVPQGLQGGYKTAKEYADGTRAHNREVNLTPEPWPVESKLTVQAVTRQALPQGDYYRVRISATASRKSDYVADVLVGKYRGKWLAAGTPVEPGNPATVEPTR